MQRAMKNRGALWAASMTAVAGALLATPTLPASAAPPDTTAAAEGSSIEVDLGNEIFASIDSDTGKVSMTTPTPLVWDPNLATVDRFGYGVGWTYGTRFVEIDGWPRFYFPELGQAFDFDVFEPTGLRGYPFGDVLAQIHDDAELPGRGDIPAQPYSYSLHHAGSNVTEYFGWFGQLLASINLTTQARTDWVYENEASDRLLRIVDEGQRETTFVKWGSEVAIAMPDGREVLVRTPGRVEHEQIVPSWDFVTATHSTSFFTLDYGLPGWFEYVETRDAAGLIEGRRYRFLWDEKQPGVLTRAEYWSDDEGWVVVYPSF